MLPLCLPERKIPEHKSPKNENKKTTYHLGNLFIRQSLNVVLGTVGETQDVGLDRGLALAALGLRGGARLVLGALEVEEPVPGTGAEAARRVRQANVLGAVVVALGREVRAAAARHGAGTDAPRWWDLC